MKTNSKKEELVHYYPGKGYYMRTVKHEITHERFIVPWQMEEKDVKETK